MKFSEPPKDETAWYVFFANETMEKRKAQLDKLKEAKRAGKIAYFVLDRLVIKDRRRVESS